MSTTDTAPAQVPARPAQPPRRSRPLTEYWDFRTASWRTRDPIPVPRRDTDAALESQTPRRWCSRVSASSSSASPSASLRRSRT